MGFQRRQRQFAKHVLADLKSRPQVQGELGHDAEGAEIDDCAGKDVAVHLSRERDKFPVAIDELDPGDRDGKVAQRP